MLALLVIFIFLYNLLYFLQPVFRTFFPSIELTFGKDDLTKLSDTKRNRNYEVPCRPCRVPAVTGPPVCHLEEINAISP